MESDDVGSEAREAKRPRQDWAAKMSSKKGSLNKPICCMPKVREQTSLNVFAGIFSQSAVLCRVGFIQPWKTSRRSQGGYERAPHLQ
eukprot:3664879-Amphidinium_carterae.1